MGAMKIKQLSVYLENKPGGLSVPCKALADSGVNILALSLADTHRFGVLRLIVEDCAAAREVLQRAGCVVAVDEVVAVKIADEPGALARVLESVERAGVNLEYLYSFTLRAGGKAVLVFRFEDPDAAVAALRKDGVGMIDNIQIAGQA